MISIIPRKRGTILASLLLALSAYGLSANAQSIHYVYNSSGERIQRYAISLHQNASSRASNSNGDIDERDFCQYKFDSTREMLHLTLEDMSDGVPALVTIHTSGGALVRSFTVTYNTAEIPLGDLNRGLYLITVRKGENETTVKVNKS